MSDDERASQRFYKFAAESATDMPATEDTETEPSKRILTRSASRQFENAGHSGDEHMEPRPNVSTASRQPSPPPQGNLSSIASTSHSSRRSRAPTRDIDGPASTRLLGQLTEYFDEKFTVLKRDLVEEHEQISATLEKRLRTTDHEFKRKGNQVQYEHNISVSKQMQEARLSISRDPPAIRRALDSLEEGLEINYLRNKHIIIADTCEGGWQTVQEYTHREVADNSDDDKRIRKAEAAAVRKIQQKKKTGGFRGRGRGSYSFRGSGGYGETPRYSRGPQPNDLCFLCGQSGHWKRYCTKRSSAASATVTSAPQ